MQNNNAIFKKWLLPTGISVFWLAIWYLIYALVGRDVLIPSPFVVVGRMLELSREPAFWLDVSQSILRIGLGLGIALFVGLLGGAISSANPVVYVLTKPILTVITATPVVSFIIITLVWFPSSQVVVFITFLMCVPIIWNNTMKGVKSTDPSLVEMATFYQVSRGKMLKWLYIPTLMPYLSAAMSSVFGLAWKVGVAAEVLSHPKWGIGTQLYHSKIHLDSESLFAWTAVVVILSVVFEKMLGKLFLQSQRERRNISRRIKRKNLRRRDFQLPDPLHDASLNVSSTLGKPLVEGCLIKEVTFAYGSRVLLDRVTQLFPGERVHCFCGPSGSGKTTLLRLLSGLIAPKSGSIQWIPKYSLEQSLRRGYVFQEDRLLPWATVRENLEFVLESDLSQRADVRRTVDALLSSFRLDGYFDAFPSELSGGMRQRVNVARALVVSPSILYLDEAFKGLDQALKGEVIAITRQHIKRNRSIVFMATHELEEAAQLESDLYELEGSSLRCLDFHGLKM